MELLNKILGNIPFGLGATLGYMGAMWFMDLSLGRIIGNGLALLLGWVLGDVLMFYTYRLVKRFRK